MSEGKLREDREKAIERVERDGCMETRHGGKKKN